MKKIKYELFSMVNYGTEEQPDMKPYFYATKTMSWSEANEAIAQHEAYNGEYTIEDDGQPKSASAPTTEERVEALEAAVTMLCMPDVSEV